jgi:hypothetical protein
MMTGGYGDEARVLWFAVDRCRAQAWIGCRQIVPEVWLIASLMLEWMDVKVDAGDGECVWDDADGSRTTSSEMQRK